MGYRDLYDYCQGLATPVNRNAIRDKLYELLPDRRVRVVVSDLNMNFVLGYYVSARNEGCRFVQQCGGKSVIVIARGLNRCWQRFVTVKEMMHLFDDPLETTNSAADLETLLADFCGSAEPGELTPQMRSEIDCFWMAIGLLCPENVRVDLQQRREGGAISDAEIAQLLLVPAKYVPAFFHPRYKEILSRLTEK